MSAATDRMQLCVTMADGYLEKASAEPSGNRQTIEHYRNAAEMEMYAAERYAAVAQAEAAERQAAALEGIYNMLRYIAPAIEYQAAGDVSPEFKAGAAVEAMHADNVDSDPYGNGYNGPRIDLFGARDDDQRAEDNASYNAGIAPGLHR